MKFGATDDNIVKDAVDEHNNGKDVVEEIDSGNFIVISYQSDDETTESNSETLKLSQRAKDSIKANLK